MTARSKKEIDDMIKLKKKHKIKRDIYSLFNEEKTKECDSKIFELEKKIILKKLDESS